MSTIIKKRQKKLAPIGLQIAHCVWLIKAGTHENKYEKAKNRRDERIILSFELSGCKTVFKEEDGEEPFLLSRTFNQSLHKKSGLVLFLKPWIGGEFAKQLKCDLAPLILGKPCYVNVIHETNNDGETKAIIIGVMPVSKETVVPEQILPSLEYSVEDGFNEVFDQLPVWMQELIEASDEVAGARPTETEIVERNVRQATANALEPRPHRPVGIDESTSTEPDKEAINAELAAANGDGGVPF